MIVDASVMRGFGLSNSVGTAAFRLGSTEPTFFVPCTFLRQATALCGNTVPDDENLLRVNKPMPRERLTIRLGNVSVWGIFDNNLYAHDARTQSSAGRRQYLEAVGIGFITSDGRLDYSPDWRPRSSTTPASCPASAWRSTTSRFPTPPIKPVGPVNVFSLRTRIAF